MRIRVDISALRQTRWYEYVLRVLFGGAITVVTGLLAGKYGPVLGGLFLAFPAIFPASATLVEKHETDKKCRAGFAGPTRGRKAAALDARGAALGSVGLICFAALEWRLLPSCNSALSFIIGLGAWLFVSIALWQLCKLRHGKPIGRF